MRQREVQEVEDRRRRGEDVRAGRRMERVLEDLGRDRSEEQQSLDRQDVGDVDGDPEVVGVAAHQLVGEEQPDERDPVAQEQAAAAEQDGGEAEGDEQHVRRDRDAPDEHQGRQDHDVGGDRPEQDPVVAPTEGRGLGRFAQVGHEVTVSKLARHASASA